MYRISVVIPTYNREKHIKHAVESVLAQEGQGEVFDMFEVLIIDDGSTDNTEDIVQGITDERIIYHKLPTNKGAVVAWNTGISIAEGDWIAFQDSDDEWHSDKLLKQIRYLSEHEDCDLVSHPFRAFFADGSEICTRVVDSEDMIEELARSNFIGTPTMLVRRSALLEMGGFNPEIKSLNDWYFVIGFVKKYKIGMVPDVLLDVNMGVEGMSADISAYYESRCRIISDNKEILLEHNCFDEAVRSLLIHAEKNDILAEVGRMLELFLEQGQRSENG